MQVSIVSETRRDQSPTLSQDSRPWNRVLAAKDQGSDKNLVNLGPRNARWRFLGALELSSDAFRPCINHWAYLFASLYYSVQRSMRVTW